MELDIGTLSLMVTLSFILQSVMLVTFTVLANEYRGISRAAAGNLIYGLGYSMAWLHGRLPNEAILAGGIVFTLCGAAIISDGLAQFLDRPASLRRQAPVIAIAMMIGLGLVFIYPDQRLRILVVSLATGGLLALPGVRLFFFSRAASYHTAAMLTGIPFLVSAAFMLLRAPAALLVERPAGLLEPSPLQAPFFTLVFVCSWLWTGGFLLMVATRLRHDLHEQARRDLLTGLPNRRAMTERLAHARGEFETQGAPFSVLLIDIDHFKDINDQFGHGEGDRTLRQVADALRDGLRKVGQFDYVARWGGEEFLVMLPTANLQAAAVVAERLRSGIAALPPSPPRTRPITVSIGVGAWSDSCMSHEDLLRAADRALYAAKEGGRNQVRF